jgi:nucleoside phosphorylase
MVAVSLIRAKKFLKTVSTSPNINKDFFNGLNIWISASSRKKEIIDLAQRYQIVFQKLGANIIQIDKNLGNDTKDHIDKLDLIIMFAATPGISARALEICNKWPEYKYKMYIYMPKEYEEGFIRRRLAEFHGVKRIRHLEEKSFCLRTPRLFEKCLYDILQENQVKRMRAMLAKSEHKPNIGIITALPHELNAVLETMYDIRLETYRTPDEIYQEYRLGTIRCDFGGKHNIVVARAGKGNNKAAVLATNLINKYPTIKEIFMVGVAAGVPNVKNAKEHVRLGDIVISDEHGVIQYDFIKQNTNLTHYDPPARPPSHAWLTHATNHLALMKKTPRYWSYLDKILANLDVIRPKTGPLRDCPWASGRKAIKQPTYDRAHRKRPRILAGPIASSNTVLKSARVRDKIRDVFKVKAIEMEASGIAEATWQAGKGYLVVRGICDFANDDKNKKWQPYAAAAAAAFTRDLIETMPLMQE